MSCIFCKIVQKKIWADPVLETEDVLAFHDSAPQAPIHVLVIPKKHLKTILDLEVSNGRLGVALLSAVQTVATQLGLAEQGFRVVANTGRDGGQAVDHFHFHILGGRSFSWPPG